MLQIERKVLPRVDAEHGAARVVEVVEPEQRVRHVLVPRVAGVAAEVDHDARRVVGPDPPQLREERLLRLDVPAVEAWRAVVELADRGRERAAPRVRRVLPAWNQPLKLRQRWCAR